MPFCDSKDAHEQTLLHTPVDFYPLVYVALCHMVSSVDSRVEGGIWDYIEASMAFQVKENLLMLQCQSSLLINASSSYWYQRSAG